MRTQTSAPEEEAKNNVLVDLREIQLGSVVVAFGGL